METIVVRRDRVLKTLSELMAIVDRRKHGFAYAARRVKDRATRDMLHGLARQRDAFVDELRMLLVELGETHSHRQRGAADPTLPVIYETAAAADNDASMLRACAQSERAALGVYERCLHEPLPSFVADVVKKQHYFIALARHRVGAMVN